MSFADEIRAQVKTKETLVREEARRQKESSENSRKYCIREFEKITAEIKKRISDAAKEERFTQNGLNGGMIQDTVILQTTGEVRPDERVCEGKCINWLPALFESWRIVEKPEILRHRGGFLRRHEELWRLSLKAEESWFGEVLRDAISSLRQEGIEASFTLEWRIGCYHTASPAKIYKFPLEQLAAGFQTEVWLDSDLHKTSYLGEPYLDTYNNTKLLYCTYQFRF